MKRLGTVSHYARQGFLIIRCEHVPELNSKVFDKELNMVGIVKDVFGPVGSPYVAVKPSVKNPEAYVGAFLYVETRRRGRSRDKNKSRGKNRKERYKGKGKDKGESRGKSRKPGKDGNRQKADGRGSGASRRRRPGGRRPAPERGG
ncbi:MAG: H/ACA RNA-protein complex protein Gar1 [Thermococci archaeon]|nr:H/ACA RNA-protein complex protein Gar1 [Thermococci archaeon]